MPTDLDPVAPDPVAPDPVAPDPVAPDPVIASAARQSMPQSATPESAPIPGAGRWCWDAARGAWQELPLTPEPATAPAEPSAAQHPTEPLPE